MSDYMIDTKQIKDQLLHGKQIDKRDALPVYVQLANILKDFIAENCHELEALPKEVELCRLYGVSRDSMAKAMACLVEENYVTRIKRKGTFINRDKFAETLKASQYSSQIGVVWPRSSDWNETLRGIQEKAQSHGYKTKICLYDWHRLDDQLALLEELTSTCAGIILYPNCHGSDSSYLKRLKALNYPVVLVDLSPEALKLPLITSANKNGSLQLVNHMLENGYKKIAFLGNSRRFSTTSDRHDGYKQALLEAGLSYDPSIVFFRVENHSSSQVDDIAATFLEQVEPDGVFCADHGFVVSCLRHAAKHNLSIPEDFGITAFDNIPTDEFLASPLTVVEQSFYEMGLKAGCVLIDELEHNNKTPLIHEIPVKIIVRESACRKRTTTASRR